MNIHYTVFTKSTEIPRPVYGVIDSQIGIHDSM